MNFAWYVMTLFLPIFILICFTSYVSLFYYIFISSFTFTISSFYYDLKALRRWEGGEAFDTDRLEEGSQQPARARAILITKPSLSHWKQPSFHLLQECHSRTIWRRYYTPRRPKLSKKLNKNRFARLTDVLTTLDYQIKLYLQNLDGGGIFHVRMCSLC